MKTWGVRGTLAAVAVAVVIGGLGGAAGYAVTGGTMVGHASAGWPSGPGGAGPSPFHGTAPDRPMAATSADVVHTESVVDAGDGRFRTELTQTGTVTKLETTSVTVRSADGYQQHYRMPADASATPLAIGDEVELHATETATAAPPEVTSIRRIS